MILTSKQKRENWLSPWRQRRMPSIGKYCPTKFKQTDDRLAVDAQRKRKKKTNAQEQNGIYTLTLHNRNHSVLQLQVHALPVANSNTKWAPASTASTTENIAFFVRWVLTQRSPNEPPSPIHRHTHNGRRAHVCVCNNRCRCCCESPGTANPFGSVFFLFVLVAFRMERAHQINEWIQFWKRSEEKESEKKKT